MDYANFQKLLRKAIGMRSQAEFARSCGISTVQINRFLNNPSAAGRPSVTTLQKIAKYAENGITYADFLRACDYSDVDLDFYEPEEEIAKGVIKDRIRMSLKNRILACEEDIVKGFSSFIPSQPWETLGEFIDYVFMIWAVEDLAYDISEEKLNRTDASGKYYSKLTISWASGVGADEQYHVVPGLLFYYKTEDGQYVISKASFAVKDLIEFEVIEHNGSMSEDMFRKNIFTFSKKKYPDPAPDEKKIDDRFAGTMLNGIKTKIYPDLICGRGFEVTNGMPNVLGFLETHKDTFIHSPFDEDIFNDVLQGQSPYEAYSYFEEDDIAAGKGLGALIATIMKAETGIPFGYWAEETGDFIDTGTGPEPHAYIFVSDEHRIKEDYSLKTIDDIIVRYASELGIMEYGRCYMRTTQEADCFDAYKIIYDEKYKRYRSQQFTRQEAMDRCAPNEEPEIIKKMTEIMKTITLLADEIPADEPRAVMLNGTAMDLKKLINQFGAKS